MSQIYDNYLRPIPEPLSTQDPWRFSPGYRGERSKMSQETGRDSETGGDRNRLNKTDRGRWKTRNATGRHNNNIRTNTTACRQLHAISWPWRQNKSDVTTRHLAAHFAWFRRQLIGRTHNGGDSSVNSTTVLAAAGSTVWRSVTVSYNRVRVRALSSSLKKNEGTQNWTEYAHVDAASVSDLLSRITANEADTARSLSNCRTMPKRIILIAIEFSWNEASQHAR